MEKQSLTESLGFAPGKWQSWDLKLEVSDPNPPGSQSNLNICVKRQAGPEPPERPLLTHRSAGNLNIHIRRQAGPEHQEAPVHTQARGVWPDVTRHQGVKPGKADLGGWGPCSPPAQTSAGSSSPWRPL